MTGESHRNPSTTAVKGRTGMKNEGTGETGDVIN
jgi:hypothetical protein